MNIDENLKHGDDFDEAIEKEKAHKLARLHNEDRVTLFGETHFRGQSKKFGIKAKDRTRHTYVIGKTGMGKSTLLENLAIQDIINGEGLCFIDPHGSSAEKLLSYVPEWRMKDVIYFNPSDMRYPVGLNVLEYVDEDVRHLVSSGLMNTFKKIFADQFSGRMVYLLQNAILSLLENKGESLLGINRIFIDKEYRNKIISNVTDPAVRSYWEDEFAKYTDKYIQEAAPAIQNKIGQFISNPLIRNIVGQDSTTFDVRKIMDERKILICNLSLGLTGEDNVNLIGSLLVTKIYLAALSRANLPYDELAKAPAFHLYVDEFQNFVNESFAQILSQARKYNLALIVAHQYIEQLDDVTRAAIFGNVGTMISFRVGATDAEALEKEFSPTFLAEDIVNLARFEMIVRLSIDGVSSAPFSSLAMPRIQRQERDLTQAVIALSRATYGMSKDFVEEDIRGWYSKNFKEEKKKKEEDNKIIEKAKDAPFNKDEDIKKEKPVSDSAKKEDNFAKNKKDNNLNREGNRRQKDKDVDNRKEKEELRKKDLQKIRERELAEITKTIDPVLNSLSQDNKKDVDFKNKKESLSEMAIKAASRVEIHQEKDINKIDIGGNFALREALQKAGIMNVGGDEKVKFKVENKGDTKENPDNNKNIREDIYNESKISKDVAGGGRGPSEKESINNTDNIKEDKKDKDIFDENYDGINDKYLDQLLKGE